MAGSPLSACSFGFDHPGCEHVGEQFRRMLALVYQPLRGIGKRAVEANGELARSAFLLVRLEDERACVVELPVEASAGVERVAEFVRERRALPEAEKVVWIRAGLDFGGTLPELATTLGIGERDTVGDVFEIAQLEGEIGDFPGTLTLLFVRNCIDEREIQLPEVSGPLVDVPDDWFVRLLVYLLVAARPVSVDFGSLLTSVCTLDERVGGVLTAESRKPIVELLDARIGGVERERRAS